MRKQKGEVILATVVVLLVTAFVGLVSAGSGSSKSAEAEQSVTVAQAK